MSTDRPPAVVDRAEASPATSRWHDLRTRAASGVVLVALAAITARVGGLPFMATWLAAAGATHWEWQRLLDAPSAPARIGLGWLALVLAAGLAGAGFGMVALVPLVLMVGAAAALGKPRRRVWAAAGVLYAGVPMLAVLGLRASPSDGARSIFWLFATVWCTDVFAYFGGRLIGGPKLWRRVSPSKTWSGTLTGVAAAGCVGTFVALRDLPGPVRVLPVLALTLAAAALSQAGDAFESAVKRRFRVKDSSRLIPGHGGVMDRLDGFIAAAVFAFALGVLRDPAAPAAGLFFWK